jgi:hypothetical protein
MTAQMTVVGGSYFEECCYPRKQIFRGSGCRAAALLSSLGVSVHLETFNGPTFRQSFRELAEGLGYSQNARNYAADVCFRYRFPLGHPDILPLQFTRISDEPPITAGNLLAFGLLEGRPTTHAKRVVYDPQDGALAIQYGANGSTAEELAVVVSLSEGRALTGEQEPEVIASALLGEPSTSIAIVKCGPQGALVRSGDQSAWIYPFPTNSVYKVGSGDIFSAAFAHAWLVDQIEPVEAAWFASRMVASYVESGSDRFSSEEIKIIRSQAREANLKVGVGYRRPIPATQIYLAGPFFSTSQQWLIDEVRGALNDMGFKVF